SEKYSMIKEFDAKSPKDVRQILVDPVLADKSEYVKENGDEKKEINIQDIMETDDNILLVGKKETGKTTVLQQIGLRYINEYEIRGIVPIHINMKYLPKSKDRLIDSTIQFIQRNILDYE